MDSQNQEYSIWIEAEVWVHGQWTPADDNSDVIVTFENGEKWMGTFFSYRNILSIAEQNRQTGECLGEKYLVATEMILVDQVSRQRIEKVVADLLKENEFKRYFARGYDDNVDVV